MSFADFAGGEGPAFDRIVGQAQPKAFLDRVQATGRIATGFLFHGGRGRGKHRTALGFVNRLFCEEGTGCGHCPPCRRFASGNHGDVELVGLADGKSRIAIAQIRDLKEWFSRAPFEADRRAAIIDDAHLMTEEAQNSLLKLLEEPPGQGLMILVTPDPGGLLETVHSRVQSLFFGPLADRDVLEVLSRESEASPEECRAVLALAGGSVGHALEVLAEERSKTILEAAERLFDVKTQPFEYAEFVCGGRTAGAAARAEVTAVLEAAAELLSRRISADVLGRPEGLGILEAGLGTSLESLEDIQRLILDAAESIRRNVAPRGALEALKIRLHRELARSRRRTVGGEG